MILSVIFVAISTFIIIILQDPPEDYIKAIGNETPNQVKENVANECPRVTMGIMHRTFWILLILLTVSTCIYS